MKLIRTQGTRTKRQGNAFIRPRFHELNYRKTCADAETISCAFEQLTNSVESVWRASICPPKVNKASIADPVLLKKTPFDHSWEILEVWERGSEYTTDDIDHIVKSSSTYFNIEQHEWVHCRTTGVDDGLSGDVERFKTNGLLPRCSGEKHAKYPVKTIQHSPRKHLIDPHCLPQSSSLLKSTTLRC